MVKPVTITAALCFAVLAAVVGGRALTGPPSEAAARATPLDAPAVPQPEGLLEVYYHERRPYYVTTLNQVHGLIADRANRVFKDAGVPYTWRKIPAKRQLEMIRSNDHPACAIGWFKTPEREAFGRFTLPLYVDGPTLAVARADNELIHTGASLAETLSNRRLRLLRKDGYSYGRFIDKGLARHVPRDVVTSAESLSMIKMIHSHRADYFFTTREEAEDLILCSGLPAEDFKLIHFKDMPPGNRRYLICSRRVAEPTFQKLNSAIGRFLEGRMAAHPSPGRTSP